MFWLPVAGVIVASIQGEPSGLIPATHFSSDQASHQNLADPVQVDDVEVIGRRGAARMIPEREMDGAEIDALGAWDIGEVLLRMTETLGVNDEPLVIINGKRVANSSVFFGFPPDALVRAELLPSEAGASYGGAPGQRVVNLILQKRFSSYDSRTSGARPTQGGASSVVVDLRRSAIADTNTHQLGIRFSRDTALRAEERDRHLLDVDPDARSVTLRPRADTVSVSTNLTRSMEEWSGVLSLNGQIQDSRSVVRIGGNNIENHNRSQNLGASAGLRGAAAGWTVQVNLNGRASYSQEDGFSDNRNENWTFGLSASAGRALMEFPAGPAIVNIAGNQTAGRLIADRGQVRTTADYHVSEKRGSLTIPLLKAGAATGMGRVMGDLQATIGTSFKETSAGAGDEVNGGLIWTPRKWLRVNGLWSTSTDSVSAMQRLEALHHGEPRVVFDFRTGAATEIVPILGGNADLRPPHSKRLSLRVGAGPFTSWGLSGNLGYQRAEMIDGIGILPDLSEDVEAAFPDRFQRGTDGRLFSIDYRPINFRSNLTESLASNLNFNLPRPMGTSAREATVLRVALSHNFRLQSTVTFKEGMPDLNPLNGDGGGASKQDARVMFDARRGRWGGNASARWQDGYRTRRISGWNDRRDLIREPFTAVDLRISFQLSDSSPRSAKGEAEGSSRSRSGGLQLNFEIENLLDARPKAHLGDGSPAPGYGRDIQDPIGRMMRVVLERRF